MKQIFMGPGVPFARVITWGLVCEAIIWMLIVLTGGHDSSIFIRPLEGLVLAASLGMFLPLVLRYRQRTGALCFIAFVSAFYGLLGTGTLVSALHPSGSTYASEAFRDSRWIRNTWVHSCEWSVLCGIILLIADAIRGTLRRGLDDGLPTFRPPANRWLRRVVWSLCLIPLVRVIWEAKQQPASLTERAGQFMYEQLLPYQIGAMASAFAIIWFPATIAIVCFVVTLCCPAYESRRLAKLSLTSLYWLSLFTLWIEPWMTWSGIATEVATSAAMTLVGMPPLVDMIPKLFVSLAWWFGWQSSLGLINREFKSRAASEATIPADVPPAPSPS